MPTFPLTETGRATADANGVATVTIGPQRAFERWHITGVAISSDSSTLLPELREFRGGAGGQLLGASRAGDLDSGIADIALKPGEELTYQWTNCDVGAQCRVTLDGTRSLP